MWPVIPKAREEGQLKVTIDLEKGVERGKTLSKVIGFTMFCKGGREAKIK